MKPVINIKFGADAPRDDVEILKALNYSADGGGVSVCNDSQSK